MKTNSLQEYYDHSYHKKRHKNLLEDEQYFWARSKAAAELYFSDFDENAKILEFGAGIGQNIASRINAFGFDISEDALNACRTRNIKVFDQLSSIPDNDFDIVFSRHSLEHVPDPLESLVQMKQKLKRDGTLILVLPKERHKKVSFEPDLNCHLFSWNFRSINNLLNHAGFKPILNKYEYVIGYKQLMPIYNILGYKFYYTMVKIAGRLTLENIEIVVHARRAD